MRKQQNVPDRWRIREQHDQPVNTYTQSGGWRQTVLQRADVIRIEHQRLLVTGAAVLGLRPESLFLIFGIIQFRKTVGDFSSTDEKLETVRYERIFIILA